MNYKERRMMEDDIHCHNKQKADIRFHDGALPHMKGACNYQIVRASKNPELSPEGRGFTYNHAAMLTYFENKFICQYLGGPKGEHEAPSAAFVCTSKDGIHWDEVQEAFPPIEVDSSPYKGPKAEFIQTKTIPCIVHHRMGFYTSSNHRLLMMTFYGISPDFHTVPNSGYGVGRAVREIYSDFTMSDIYFLRYNLPGGYNRENVDTFPYFEESVDEGFRAACHELLGDRLVTQQWWEEERLDTEFFTRPDGRALSYYTIPGGRVMGVFKDSMTSYTDDKGEHWSPLKKSVSIETSSGKVWGQKTPDGNFALVYNPTSDSAHRWPLAMVAGDNGIDFDYLSAIHPEVSPCRYEGGLKNLGPQYMRGITEANEYPDDRALWIAYSVNKEDMWITRVPVPAVNVETEDVNDRMSEMSEQGLRDTWNLYVPSWNGADLSTDSKGEKGLILKDQDPYDRTRAMRLFKPGTLIAVTVRLRVEQLVKGRAALYIQDRKGQNLISVVISPEGWVAMHNAGYDTPLCSWKPGEEIKIQMTVDCVENRVKTAAFCQGEGKEVGGYAAASSEGVERILIATKYDLPWQGLEVNGKDGTMGNLPGADEKQKETVVSILEVITKTLEV